jgi:hypothetical protein
MEKDRMKSMSIGAKIGAISGFVLFIIFGLIPGFYFGSYTAIILLSKIYGGPVEPNVLTRAFIVISAVLGILCSLSVSIVLGALFGTALGYLADMLTVKKRVKKTNDQKAGQKGEGGVL